LYVMSDEFQWLSHFPGEAQPGKLTGQQVYSSSQGCHTATGTHMPHGITQRYLPPGRGDIPTLTPAEAGTRLSDPKGCKAELTYLACYIQRWYNRLKTVTHPGTNRARRALTSFMRRTPLTTTLRRQPSKHIDTSHRN